MMDTKIFKVLVVDDSAVMRELIVSLLKETFPVECREAEDGARGVELYKEFKPDLVTLDINMPVLDGIGALKQIMEFDGSAKVVMLTTEVEKQKIVESVSIGAKSYIVKPIEKENAIAKIKIALGL
jgi:two-component system chemotaxis response regulator CheY